MKLTGTEWMDDGACRDVDPELFFPARAVDTEPAKRVCRGCPVREACLEYAVAERVVFGIWGGTTERQRRRLRREARVAGMTHATRCEDCGAPFAHEHHSARYCSAVCRNRASRARRRVA